MPNPCLKLVTPDFEPELESPPVKLEGNLWERLRASTRNLDDVIENTRTAVREFRSTMGELLSVTDCLEKSVNRYLTVIENIRVDPLRRKSLRLARIMGAYEDNTPTTSAAMRLLE